jgi:hypothetical protein
MGRVEVARVALRRPEIIVWQTPDGLSTDSLGAASEAPPPDAAPTEQLETPAAVVALIDISDGRLRFVDSSSGEVVETKIEQLDFEAANVNLSDPIHFGASAALFSAPSRNAQLRGTVGPLDPELASQSPVELELWLDKVSVEALLQSPAFAGSLPPELSANGDVELQAFITGSLAQLEIRWSLDATAAALRYGDLLDKPVGTPLEIELDGKVVGDTFELASSTLKLDRALAQAQGSVRLAEPTTYDLQLRSEALPLAGWEAILPPLAGLGLGGTAGLDLRVLGTASDTGLPKLDGSVRLQAFGVRLSGAPTISGLSTTLTVAKGGAKLPASGLELGGSRATLAASVADLEKPVVVFELSSPELSGAALGLADDSGLEALRKLEVSGEASTSERGPRLRAELSSASGRISGLDYQNLSGVLRYAGSLATIEKLRFEAYQGIVSGSGEYDMARAEDPRFDVKASVRGVRIEALAVSQFGEAGKVIVGAIEADLSLAGHGNDADAIKRALTGQGRIQLAEGVIRDINIADTALASVTGVPGLTNMISPTVREKHPGVFSTGDTIFDTLQGLLDIRDGRLQFNDLRLAARDYSLKAGGSIGLDSSVDIMASLTTSRELTQDLIGSSKTVRYITGPSGQIEVPVKLGGSLNSMKAQPDIAGLTRRAASNAASTALTDLLNKKLEGKHQDPPAAPDAAGEPAPPRQDTPPPAPVDPLEDLLRRGIERGVEGLP